MPKFTGTWRADTDDPIVVDTEIAGGYQVVANEQERLNIEFKRRKVGMVVYQQDSGVLYRLTSSGFVEDTLTGPQGATGLTGQQGPPGDAGPPGPQGATGPVGPQGATGPVGQQGTTGPGGPQGATGQLGPPGPQGATGLAGPQGQQGPPGSKGPVGQQGPPGQQGATGPSGDTGATGPPGSTGPIPLSGFTGPYSILSYNGYDNGTRTGATDPWAYQIVTRSPIQTGPSTCSSLSGTGACLDNPSVNFSTGTQGIKLLARYGRSSTPAIRRYFVRFNMTDSSSFAGISILSNSATVSYGAFSGGHSGEINNKYEKNNYTYGMIVRLVGKIRETDRYICEMSNIKEQKGCIGIFTSFSSDNRFPIMCLGNGLILVNSQGGNIEIGDFICSSDEPGIGMKQEQAKIFNYTVARSCEQVIWENEQEQKKLINCVYIAG